MADAQGRVLRHTVAARGLHALNAAAILALIATGLALAGFLPDSLTARMGGHVVANTTHRMLGLAFVIAAAAAAALLHARCRRFARDIVGSGVLGPHAQRLSAAQRAVFAILVISATIAGVSGVYLYVLPKAPLWVFLVAIRAHVYGSWVLIAALSLHIVAGLGILPTHRGIARSMFGDGTVPLRIARTLWPGWAEA
ncbi:MAG: hypothetical protein EPN41_01825, partial [Candidimonas sp.]